MAGGGNMGRVGAREIVAVDEGDRARHGHSMRMLRVMMPQTSNVWPSAANLLDQDARRVSERITAYALYTDPPLGRVGMTLAEARNSGRQSSWSQQRLDRLPRGHRGVPRMVTGRQSLVNARKIMLQWL